MDSQKIIETLQAASGCDEKMSAEARKELAAMPVWTLNSVCLVNDEVSETLAGRLERPLANELAFFTLESVKRKLIEKNGSSWVRHYRGGLSPEAISALGKIMTDEEIEIVSGKIFNPLPGSGETTVGSWGHFGSQLETNSTSDYDWKRTFFALLDGVSYGCGDVLVAIKPSCHAVETVVRSANLLSDIVLALRLPTRRCIMSDMTTLARAKEQGAKIDLGFQRLSGTSAGLKSSAGTGMKEILDLAYGFSGLFFEIVPGIEASNGADADGGIDAMTLSSRAAGLARHIERATGKWTVVKTAMNRIGVEVFRKENELYRATLESVFIQKMHGVIGGIDVRAPFHLGIHPEDLRMLARKLVCAARPAFVTSTPGGVDMLSSRDYPSLCVSQGGCPTSAMKHRLTELGVMERGLVKATPATVEELYAEYQRVFGDERPAKSLCARAKIEIAQLQSQGFDIGHGCPRRFLVPEPVSQRINRVYEAAKKERAAAMKARVSTKGVQCQNMLTTLPTPRSTLVYPAQKNNFSLYAVV